MRSGAVAGDDLGGGQGLVGGFRGAELLLEFGLEALERLLLRPRLVSGG